VPYVDTHCHLDHHFELSAATQVAKAREAGVTTLITVGTDMASSTEAVATARRHDGVFAAVGVHPNDAMEASPQVLEVIARLATEPDVVAVGETGLDYYRDHTTPEQQEASYRAHIDIAREHDRTLVVHCREAWDDCLRILEDSTAPRTGWSCTASRATRRSSTGAPSAAGTCPSPATSPSRTLAICARRQPGPRSTCC
jgi:TatD DNase family protein